MEFNAFGLHKISASVYTPIILRVARAHQVLFTRCANHFVANVEYILAAYRRMSHDKYFSNDPRKRMVRDIQSLEWKRSYLSG